MKNNTDKFHKHLDQCAKCKNYPFNLCSEGDKLLRETMSVEMDPDILKLVNENFWELLGDEGGTNKNG